jgi:hypothetical protein
MNSSGATVGHQNILQLPLSGTKTSCNATLCTKTSCNVKLNPIETNLRYLPRTSNLLCTRSTILPPGSSSYCWLRSQHRQHRALHLPASYWATTSADSFPNTYSTRTIITYTLPNLDSSTRWRIYKYRLITYSKTIRSDYLIISKYLKLLKSIIPIYFIKYLAIASLKVSYCNCGCLYQTLYTYYLWSAQIYVTVGLQLGCFVVIS